MRSDWSRDRFKTLDNWTGQDFCNAPSNDEIRSWRRIQNQEEQLERLQLARKEAAIASYERALKDKSVRDKLVAPHKLDEGQWVLVRHEKPQKFEAKRLGPYQVVQRMLLGTYRLQDPNGREWQR